MTVAVNAAVTALALERERALTFECELALTSNEWTLVRGRSHVHPFTVMLT